jgi:hypothetical protein
MIDLSLAFDCIDTGEILPEKLKHYGACPKTTQFFKNFFTGRKHLTEWFGATSDTLKLSNYSCVQGSCLGAPTFNLYTKDLQKICDSQIINFADDTNLLITSKNPNNLIDKANKDLKTITDYMAANSLIINPTKTQAMVFKPKNKKTTEIQNNLAMEGKQIDFVTEARYLGLTLDNKLNFKPQFNKLTKKLKTATRALISTRKLLNSKAKLMIYNSLFKSNLEYGSISYHDKLKSKQLDTITKLQKKCLRLVYNSKPRTHTKSLYEKSNITPAKETFKAESIKLIFKTTNELTKNKQPKAIAELINLKQNNQRATRLSKNTYKIPLKKHYPGTLIYQIIKSWNETDEEIKNCGNVKILTKTLNKYLQKTLVPCEVKKCHSCSQEANTPPDNTTN